MSISEAIVAETTIQIFSSNLRSEMARKQLTTKNLSQKTGIEYRHLQSLWFGTGEPCAQDVTNILTALGLPLWRLMTDPAKWTCQGEVEL